MKKRFRFISIASLLILAYFIFQRDAIKLDGLSGEIFGLLIESDTQYSGKYSHKKFSKLRVGMTEEQVVNLIGEPLSKWQPYTGEKSHYIGFVYSKSPSSTNYRYRLVNFEHGKVAEIVSYFYTD